MAWDFETDPEFQELLDWADAFVRDHAHGVTQARGGEGAAREFCELIMRAQGTLAAAQNAYL